MPNDDADIDAAHTDAELIAEMSDDEQRTAAIRVARNIWGDTAAAAVADLLDNTNAPGDNEQPD